MAITLVGSAHTECATASTCTVTYSPTAGNFIAVGVFVHSVTGAITSVTDTAGTSGVLVPAA